MAGSSWECTSLYRSVGYGNNSQCGAVLKCEKDRENKSEIEIRGSKTRYIGVIVCHNRIVSRNVVLRADDLLSVLLFIFFSFAMFNVTRVFSRTYRIVINIILLLLL